MRMRCKKGSRYETKDFDLGDGFYVVREKFGSCITYRAMQLDRPGGYVTKPGRAKAFSYRKDADAQIEAWRREDFALPV